MTSLGDFTFTKHALQRALDMGVTAQQIRHCLTTPDKVWPSPSYAGYTNYRHGLVTLSVSQLDNAVVTVLWATKRAWDEDCPDSYGRLPANA